jgi:hypothetical protein
MAADARIGLRDTAPRSSRCGSAVASSFAGVCKGKRQIDPQQAANQWSSGRRPGLIRSVANDGSHLRDTVYALHFEIEGAWKGKRQINHLPGKGPA